MQPVEPALMPLNELAREAALGVKRRLLEQYPSQVLEVRVYGSRARGDAHEESDLDLLILTADDAPDLELPAIRAARAVLEELDYPFPISPLIMTRGHFHELLSRERLFARTVLEEGVPV